MTKANRTLFLKPVSALLIPSLLFTQTAWAVDVRQMLADAKAGFEQEEALRPRGMGSSTLQEVQQSQQQAVDQQQTLQDLQSMNFSLTTPNGDVLQYIGSQLESVERPDGTRLQNIVTDAAGNIVSSDLQLSDGSVQVFQNGQVLGYMTPDGTQVIYSNGRVQKTISKSNEETLYSYTLNGSTVTETVLDSPSRQTKYDAGGKIKETTRKSDNQKIIYLNGVIQKIINADGSQVQFASQVVGTDTVVTPQGAASAFYTDAQGNKFYFSGGSVSNIVLTDGSTIDGITWDAANKIDGATLTQTDGSKFVYQAKQLTRSYDAAGVVTNYSYTATAITAAKGGSTWEYLLDKTAVKSTDISGNVATYIQTGTYKGLKATETIAGVTYTYSYQGSGSTLTAQRTSSGASVILSIGVFNTTSRQTDAYGRRWSENLTEGSLYTDAPYMALTYTVNLAQAGNLALNFDSTNWGANIPSNWSFQFDFAIDGTWKWNNRILSAPGSGWKSNQTVFTGLTAGQHVLTFLWSNDCWVANQYDANLKIKNLVLSLPSSGSTNQTVTSGYQSTPLTSRMDFVKNSTIVKPAVPGSINSTDFSSITYDSLARLKQVLFKDGSKLIFDQGVLKQAYDAAGKLTSFNFEQSALSNIVGSTITQSNLTSTYSADGKLSSVQTGNITVHYKPGGQAVDWIEKSDGTELWDLVFDAAGALKDAVIYTPDGEVRSYQAGKLVSVQKADHSKLLYANDKPVQLITPEALTYNFTYTPTAVQATLAAGLVPDALTPVRMEYDLNFNLKKVTRQNQEILNYLNTDLIQIDAPGNASKVFSYQKDAQGKVLSYTVTQANVVTSYDASNNPVSAVINPTTANPNAFNVSYSYGRIRQVKKNNVVVFNYTYSVDAKGNEIATVDDLETNSQKTYQDGNLATSLDKATQVLTSYAYVSGKVSRVTVSRFGRMFHDYVYSYSGTDTVVTDEEGIVRTYGSDGKLKFLERDGQKFSYNYTTQTITETAPGGTTQTVLPISLYNATLSNKSWDGQTAWFSWEKPYGNDYLVTYWQDQWVQYTANMSQAGDLKIALQAINDGALPAGYANFQLDVAVDGVSKGTFNVAASASAWQNGTINLTGLSQGSHTIRIKWLNQVSDAAGNRSNFKFRSISFTQITTASAATTRTVNLTQELLSEKRFSDGTLVHYAANRVSQIDYADGRVLKNFVTDTDGNISEVRVFANAQDTVGTKVNFTGGLVSKATLPSGQALLFTYDKDASGIITNTWVQKGAAHLKYDAQNNLAGLRIDGVMNPDEILAITTHIYTGGNGGFLSYDGNSATAQTGAFGGGTGNNNADLFAEHDFPVANAVTQFSYRLDASSNSSGSTNNGSEAVISLETKDASTGLWTLVPGTYSSQSHSNGGGGGSTAFARTSGTGLTTLAVNIPNVIAVRAHARSSAYSNGGGSYGGQAYIYEVQFQLADQSALTLDSAVNVAGQSSNYTFSGYVGTIGFDAAGKLTKTDSDLTAIQQELTGVVQNFVKNPYSNPGFLGMWAANSDSETVVSQEYSADGTLETQSKADGTVTLFENNKPSKVLDRKGEMLIQYAYDAAGNPTRVYLKNARDTLPDAVAAARLEIEKKRAEALRTLAQQKNLAYQSIQTQFQNARLVLDSQMSQQKALYDEVSGSTAKGKDAKSQKADALNQLDGNITLIQTNLTSLYSQEADAYAALDTQVKTVSDQIEADSVNATTNLAAQEANMKREILRQEVSPLVYDYYRRILGRDPDTNEYNSWINQIDYNSGATVAEVKTTAGVNLTQALNASINALPELAQRQAYVNAIKSAVTTEINNYLAMTQAQKEAYAATLGLTPADLISLSSADATKILAWVNSRSLHFGQSAFLALESLLDQKGEIYTRETLAKQAVLIDILSGVISPLDDGELVLSVFALNKTAKIYGVDLVGASLSWADLKSVVPATSGAGTTRVVAHINGNHFVIVTAITDTSITYIDPGIGKDKQNESVTLTKEGFLKIWEGNTALESTKAQSISNIQSKTLTASQAKSVRGAFWGSVLGIFGTVLSWIPGLQGVGFFLTALSSVVSAIEGDFVSAISSIVSLGLGNIGNFFQSAFDGVVKAMGPIGQIFSAAGNVISNIYGAVTGLIGNMTNTLGGFLKGFGIGSKIATDIARTTVSTGLSIATSKGLQAIGVNPQIAGFAGSLASGLAVGSSMKESTVTIMGETRIMVSQAQYVQQSLSQVVSLSQIGQLGLSFGLDPNFSQILGLSLGAIQGAQIINPQTTLQQAFSQVKPQVASSLAQYGVQKLGDSLGIDSRISNLIGAPISAATGAALQPNASIITAINQGLASGVTSLGIEYATQQAGLDPLLGSLTSRAITGAIDQSLGSNVFERVFNAFSESTLNMSRLGVTNYDSYSQAQYISRVINFSSTIQTRGLSQAIEDYAAGILHQDAVSSILKTFSSVKAYIDDLIAKGKLVTVVIGGVTYKRLDLPNGDYQLFDSTVQNLVEVKQGNRILKGTFGVDERKNWGIRTGSITEYDTQGQVKSISNYTDGNLTEIQIGFGQGVSEPQFVIKKSEGSNGIRFNTDGSLRDADIEGSNSYTFKLRDGLVDEYDFAPTNISSQDLSFFSGIGISSADLAATRLHSERNGDGSYSQSLTLNASVDANGNYIVLGENFGKNVNNVTDNNYWTSTSFRDKYEITLNYYKGLGTRTDRQIAESYKHEREITLHHAQDGDILVFSGTSPVEPVIKAFEAYKGNGGPIMSHLGVVTTIGDRKYVFEIFAADPNNPESLLGINVFDALKMTPLETALNRYGEVDSLGNVTKVKGDFKTIRVDNNLAATNTTNWIRNNFFKLTNAQISALPSTQVINSDPDLWFNLGAIFNVNNNDTHAFVCSELYLRAYYEGNITTSQQILPGINRDYSASNWQSIGQRVTPQDIFNARDQYGEPLSEIVASQSGSSS